MIPAKLDFPAYTHQSYFTKPPHLWNQASCYSLTPATNTDATWLHIITTAFTEIYINIYLCWRLSSFSPILTPHTFCKTTKQIFTPSPENTGVLTLPHFLCGQKERRIFVTPLSAEFQEKNTKWWFLYIPFYWLEEALINSGCYLQFSEFS